MRSREVLLTAVALLIAAAIGFVVLDEPAQAAEPDPFGGEPVVTAPAPAVDQEFVPDPVETAMAAAAADAPDPARKVIDPNRKDGTISGTVILSADAARVLEKFQVRIVEAASNVREFEERFGRRPFNQTLVLEYDQLTSPDFRVESVPFSPYGYHVDVWIAEHGLNGTGQFIAVKPEDPDAGVTLGITRAPSFAVRLSDQTRAPVGNQTVILVPQGLPLGRPTRKNVSDTAGIARFDALIRGEYAITVGTVDRPRNPERERVQVQATAGSQIADVKVPIGHDLEIVVHGNNWSRPEAKIQAYRTDTQLWRPLEATVDRTGRAKLEHLEPGEYLLNVTAPGYEVRTRTVRIQRDAPPRPIELRLGLISRR